VSNRAHRARRDTSEPEVTRALDVCGYRCKKLAQKGIPDLLVWHPRSRRVWLAECKTGNGKLRETQDWAALGLHVEIFRCAEDVFSWHMGKKVRVAKGG